MCRACVLQPSPTLTPYRKKRGETSRPEMHYTESQLEDLKCHRFGSPWEWFYRPKEPQGLHSSDLVRSSCSVANCPSMKHRWYPHTDQGTPPCMQTYGQTSNQHQDRTFQWSFLLWEGGHVNIQCLGYFSTNNIFFHVSFQDVDRDDVASDPVPLEWDTRHQENLLLVIT